MSNQINTALLERAQEMIDYWTGTNWAKTIEQDIKYHDYEALAGHVTAAEQEAWKQEYLPDEKYQD